jgi:hypothetical protein
MENKNIKDIIHLYFGCECETYSGKRGTFAGFDICEKDRSMIIHTVRYFDVDDYDVLNDDEMCEQIKLILRPLSDLTEEEFKEYSKPKTFATYGGYWYACDRELDPDFEGDVIEHINEACDDDPENVIMCHAKSKSISYGWIEYEDKYHGFGMKENATWIAFLLAKGFDLFGLIPAGLAIDKTKLTDHGN